MLYGSKIYPLLGIVLLGGVVAYAALSSSSGDDPSRAAADVQGFLPGSDPRAMGTTAARNPIVYQLGTEVMDVGQAEARCLGLSWPARGAIVDCVISGCAASQSGLKLDDIIVAVNGQPVFNRSQFWSLMANQPTSVVTLDVLSGGQQKRITLSSKANPGAAGPGAVQAAALQNPCVVCPL